MQRASELVADIDVKDEIYVAFSLFLQAKLWLGDKSLTRGLLAKKVEIIIDSIEVFNVVIQ